MTDTTPVPARANSWTPCSVCRHTRLVHPKGGMCRICQSRSEDHVFMARSAELPECPDRGAHLCIPPRPHDCPVLAWANRSAR